MKQRPRIVIAGLGDTGLLVAIHLARHAEVVGISSKPGLVSGQELGMRLTRPHEWRRDYWIPFDRYRRLDGVRTMHGTLTGLDPDARVVTVTTADGTPQEERYDALVISTGVTNGFWRTPDLQQAGEVSDDLEDAHRRIAAASSVIVVGGGAAAVSSAWNIATTWPDKRVDLYFPGEAALPGHHPQVWATLSRRLAQRGVGLHPGHRAELPAQVDELTADPVAWTTGQPSVKADVVLWAIGRVRPNTAWLPRDLLDAEGFVEVDAYLRAKAPGVYAIGDVAATDPLRTSARARADGLLARNIRADLGHGRARRFTPMRRRWGSVLGTQNNRLEVFSPTGRSFVIPAWSSLQPWLVRRAIYRGIRR
ncbi:MAG: FAD-dependent oxidoreductase [Marmoricola sp.]